jgi:hypothetical protein
LHNLPADQHRHQDKQGSIAHKQRPGRFCLRLVWQQTGQIEIGAQATDKRQHHEGKAAEVEPLVVEKRFACASFGRAGSEGEAADVSVTATMNVQREPCHV